MIKRCSFIFLLLVTYPSVTWSDVSISDSPNLSSHHINGSINWTSNYVYRGVTLSNENPSWQAALMYQHDQGIFGHVWLTETDSGTQYGPDTENNVLLGYSRPLSFLWRAQCNVTYFKFNGGAIGFDDHFNQWQCGVGYDRRYEFRMSQMNNSYGLRFESLLYEVSYTVPINIALINTAWLNESILSLPSIHWHTNIGHWDISDFVGAPYNFLQSGLTQSFKSFSYGIHYHWASSVGRDTGSVEL
jgi:uncharacterized protein (TIGR02001 family)